MKRFFVLLWFICLAHTSISFAQPKRANAIILITDSETIESEFSEAMQSLLSKGIEIISYDRELYIIRCIGPQTKSRTKAECTLICLQDEDRVILRVTGRYTNPIDDFRSESVIEFRGQKGSVAMQAWNSMHEVAYLIPHRELVYDTL